MDKVTSLVLSVQDHRILIRCADNLKFDFLKNIGAKQRLFNCHTWSLNYESKKELSDKFSHLRDEKFIFSGGSGGWHPSSIFKMLKEEGYINGAALELVWKGKDSFKLYEI